MSTLPKVSIIIPCWNAEKYIADAIGSALGQSYLNIELIVVNDGSTDGSQAVINQYSDKITSITVENGGANRARNIGFEHSTGDFIKFLDADDYLWPGSITAQVKHMAMLDDDEFSVGESFRYSEIKKTLSKYPQWENSKLIELDSIARFIRVPPPITNVMYRRHKLVEVGCFDNNVLVRQEVDLFFRYVFSRNKPKLLRYPTFIYRDHITPGRVSARKLSEAYNSDIYLLRRAVEMVKKLDALPENTQVKRALALGIWNMGRGMLRNSCSKEAQTLFDLAKACNKSSYIEGKIPYIILARLIGPIAAEVVLLKLKRITRKADHWDMTT